MDIFNGIKNILTDILDIEDQDITPETYLVRDLGAESIDLLELSVALNTRFHIEVNDDELFLRTLRLHLVEARDRKLDAAPYVMEQFPALTGERVREILADIGGGPVLKVKDLISYVAAQLGK